MSKIQENNLTIEAYPNGRLQITIDGISKPFYFLGKPRENVEYSVEMNSCIIDATTFGLLWPSSSSSSSSSSFCIKFVNKLDKKSYTLEIPKKQFYSNDEKIASFSDLSSIYFHLTF